MVRESLEPLPFREIVRRVHGIRRIDTRSPEGTIRNALSQNRQIGNTGEGRYGWYPRLINGSRVRVPIRTRDLDAQRLVFDNEVRDLLWPSFFAIAKHSDRGPVRALLPSGAETLMTLNFFGSGVWGPWARRNCGRGYDPRDSATGTT